MASFKALGSTSLLILINGLWESSGSAKWKEEELKLGLMEEDMKEILKMERKMDKAISSGLMEISISGLGKEGSSME